MNIFNTFVDLLGKVFGYVLWFFFDLFDNYALSVVCFTVLVMLIMFPFEIKRIKSTAKTARFSAKSKEIQKKYANNREKQSEELAKLYKEEGSPLKGCLPMLLPTFAFFGVFAAIRQPLSLMFNMSMEKINSAVEVFKSLSGMSGISSQNYIQLDIVRVFPQISEKLTMFDAQDIKNISDFNKGINFFGMNLFETPQGSSFGSMLWIFPALCALTAILQIFLNKKMNLLPTPETTGQNAGCMKFMPYTMIIFFVWITFISPAALGIYYITSNIFRILQAIIINKFFSVEHFNAKEEAARIERRKIEEQKIKPL